MPSLKAHLQHMLPVLAVVAFLLIIAPTVFSAEPAPQPNPDRVLSDIRARAATIETLTATFVQKRDSRLLNEPLVSEGTLYLERGRKLLMQITAPSASKLLIENHRVTLVNSETGWVVKRHLSASDQILKTWLGWGASNEDLKQRYDLHLTQRSRDRRFILKMTPKTDAVARHIRAMAVEVSADTLLPAQIVITTAKGDQTLLKLHYTAINEPLPSGIFDIKLPETFSDR